MTLKPDQTKGTERSSGRGEGLLHFRYRGKRDFNTLGDQPSSADTNRVDVDLFPSLKLCVPSVQNGLQTETQAVFPACAAFPTT